MKKTIVMLAISFMVAATTYGATTNALRRVDQLHTPISIKTDTAYPDGGTVAFHVTDVNSNVLHLCRAGQFAGGPPGEIFVGAEHPTHAGARVLQPGSDEERLLLTLVSAWFQRTFSAPDREQLSDPAFLRQKVKEFGEESVWVTGSQVNAMIKRLQQRQKDAEPAPGHVR